MALLNDNVRAELREILGGLSHSVELDLHPAGDDQATEVMRTLLGELSETVPALVVRERTDPPVVEPGHDTGMPLEGPILRVRAADGTGGEVRFLGMTVGLEFATLVEAIRQAADGGTRLSPATIQELATLNGPVHIQVFTTPT